MIPDYNVGFVVLIFLVVALALLAGILLLSWAVRPLKARKAAEEVYECGFAPKGDARAIGFLYLSYAALFLVFDLAALFLFLYASNPQPAAVTASMLVGIITLTLMIVYGTKKRRYHVA